MLDEFMRVLSAQRSALEGLERNEKELMEVRDNLNEAIRNADGRDIKDLIVVLMQTESAIIASAICSNQNQVAMTKQSISHQEVIIQKMKKRLDDFGIT